MCACCVVFVLCCVIVGLVERVKFWGVFLFAIVVVF